MRSHTPRAPLGPAGPAGPRPARPPRACFARFRYADNILRSLAQGLAIVSGAVGSYLLFDFQITAQFMLGVVLVIGAVFLYGAQASTPTELCEQLALSCLASVAPSRGDSALSDASADAPLKPAAYASVQPTEPHTADEVEEP